MILTDPKRRWAEIRFYLFCYDIFQERKDMMDIVYCIEAMAQLNTFKQRPVKSAAGKLLGDPYYVPLRDEVIILANKNGMSQRDLAKKFKLTPMQINRIIKNKQDVFSYNPQLDIDEDEQIIKFLDALDIIKKAGI